MPKFFVGQRVRILYSYGWPELKNQEGRVKQLGIRATVGANAGKPAIVVAPDIWGSSLAPYLGSHGGVQLGCQEYQLEPILPEGQKAGDFSYEELLEHLETLSHENA